ncbi:hypothetical protein C2857_001067 [Epichloe festucae Fl1]|uniref:Uncharacterized protein n=1 Tax=Epichloe festucae (strain Fl1) TaxID=877507 RepID=A0A7S9KNG4_EPIFF|nr:hypothetical protein C2857_001067 [Epichloe festucae Fl1]
MGKTRASDPIGKFFARYNQFDYDPHSEAWSEYHRMCAFFNWKKDCKKERAANTLFRDAIVAQFGCLYGVDENKLATLQRLCEKLEVFPVPQSVTSCKKAISKVHVNIMDFIDSERTGVPIRIFGSLSQLRRYTVDNDKIFPKRQARKSALLRYLLRRIL